MLELFYDNADRLRKAIVRRRNVKALRNSTALVDGDDDCVEVDVVPTPSAELSGAIFRAGMKSCDRHHQQRRKVTVGYAPEVKQKVSYQVGARKLQDGNVTEVIRGFGWWAGEDVEESRKTPARERIKQVVVAGARRSHLYCRELHFKFQNPYLRLVGNSEMRKKVEVVQCDQQKANPRVRRIAAVCPL